MKGAEVFSRLAIWVPSVIESNRTDRQFVTEAAAEPVAHVVHAGFFGSGKQVAGVKEQCALELTVNWKRVFDIEDRIEFAANRISFRIVRAEIAFAKTTHGGGASVEKSFINGQRRRLIRTGIVKRMDKARARAERER